MGGANGHTLALTMAANMPSVLVSRGLAGGMDRDSTWVKKRRSCFGGQPEDASIFFHVRRASKSRCAIARIFAARFVTISQLTCCVRLAAAPSRRR